MADTVISAAIQFTLETALSLASDRIGMLVGFKKDVDSMTQSLRLIKSVLADAEERQQNQDRAVQEWLKSLEEVAYEADNLLDELHYESLRQQVESRNRHKLKVCCFLSFSNINLAFRWRMASKVRGIKDKLNEINQQARDLKLDSREVMTAALPDAAGDTRSRETDSVAIPMTGRADDESNIVKMLLRSSKKVVSVLPIFGVGGLGKTTLAKSIYNNRQIDRRFQKKIWVWVSKKVPVVELFKLILVQLTEERVEVDDRNVIVGKIRNNLGGKRYFLVLDDVWDDDHDQALWDDFFPTLKGLNPTNGSWCLVTTRSDSVARNVSGALEMENEAYSLGRLPDKDCWSILLKKAFGKKKAPDELEQIKGRILQRCDGLPATASLIGIQLRKLNFTKKEESGSILDKLLSLDNLSSPSIKKCFAYCSMFPKDTEIERDMLIEVWMAEGFLQTDLKNEMVMEELGMNHLRILLQSWLLEEIRRDFWGVYYKMQEVAHNHAKSMSKSTKVISDGETGIVDNGDLVRYLAIDSVGEHREELFKSLKTSLLHTLFVRSSSSSGDMLMKLKNLYVLNLSGVRNQELPESIGKLIHLRFIDFSDSGSETLHQSVCKLYKLQTLRLNSVALKALPEEMSNLISMRHLHYQNRDDKFEMPLEMGRLTCLQTLEFFNVGRKKGRQIGELGSLKNLKGSLTIRNLQLVKDKKGAEEANLSEKANLLRLQLEWAQDREGNNNDVDVLDGLRPQPNLEELKIRGFMGHQFPQWSMDLPKLVSLGFDNCNGCKKLSPLQNLTSLKELTIHKCGGLTSLSGDMLQSCTSLQKLQVTECHNLTSFHLNLRHMTSLLEVELWGCPKLKTSETPQGFCFLTSLRTLSIGPFSDDDDDRENSSVYNKFDWSGLTSSSSPSTSSSSSSSSSSTLEVLKLRGLPQMKTLPDQLRDLTTLKSLTLHDFGEVETLPNWFGNFAALETLCLVEVKKLRHLPDANLTHLSIDGCPLLKERFTSRSSGHDERSKVPRRIQNISIDGQPLVRP